ncbi:MAG: hypothetical protein R2941_23345 [Desulfobacterales bacterium]
MISSALLQKIENLEPGMKDVMLSLVEEVEFKTKTITVGRGEFNELRDIVKDLAMAQRMTENRVGELAEAQKRTEKRVEELAEAQKRTEKRVEELAEAQKRTEKRVEELAEAQMRTENEVKTLVVAVKDIRKQLGGLSTDVGYGIEDRIMPYMRDFGKKEFGIDVRLVDRRNLVYPDGNYDEINICAEGRKENKPAWLIGECKAQPGKKDFDRFSQMTQRAKTVLHGEVHTFLVGYHFAPDVEMYAKKEHPHIRMCRTFEFEMNYRKNREISGD